MTSLPAVLGLLVFGVLLVGAEVAIIPGFGIPGVVGALLIVVGCYLAWSVHGPLFGMLAILGSIGISLALVLWTMRSRSAKRLVLGSSHPHPVYEAELLVGREGRVLSTLRPSGVAEIDGERHQVVSRDGDWIEKGAKVRVVRVATNSIVVVAMATEGLEAREDGDVRS